MSNGRAWQHGLLPTVPSAVLISTITNIHHWLHLLFQCDVLQTQPLDSVGDTLKKRQDLRKRTSSKYHWPLHDSDVNSHTNAQICSEIAQVNKIRLKFRSCAISVPLFTTYTNTNAGDKTNWGIKLNPESHKMAYTVLVNPIHLNTYHVWPTIKNIKK